MRWTRQDKWHSTTKLEQVYKKFIYIYIIMQIFSYRCIPRTFQGLSPNLCLGRRSLFLPKKHVESVSMLIPRGGGGVSGTSAHTSLGFFCMLQTYFVGSRMPKTNFLVIPNSIFHIFSNLFDEKHQFSHLWYVKFLPSIFCVVLIKFNPKFYQICFTAYQTTPILRETLKEKNSLRRS